jgi:Holliday junction resolvasome RuvABC DNA-binding subunit
MKNQKPTDIDVSLKYVCDHCGASHWLFLREAQTENFKIVCECKNVFMPEKIDRVNIQYSDSKTKPIHEEPAGNSLEQSTIDACAKTLISLGYKRTEAVLLVDQAYKSIHNNDSSQLIKHILQQPIGV